MTFRKKVYLIISITGTLMITVFCLVQAIDSVVTVNHLVKSSMQNSYDLTKTIEGQLPATVDALKQDKLSMENAAPADTQGQLGLETMKGNLASLSDDEIAEQLTTLKTKIYESDLINRLNAGLLNESEQADAQVVLDTITVLGIEKAERNLAKLVPELEHAIKQHEQGLKKAKSALADL